MDMESVSATNISPDGRKIVFTREWTDQMKDQLRTNLWVVDVDNGRVRELTRGGWRDTAPVWSPDSKRIAFLSDRDGTNQVHTMYLDTGEVAQLTHLPRAASGLKWSPDGRQLAFTQTLPDEDAPLKIELPKRPRGAEWAKAPNVVDRLSWARDGTGAVEKGYSHVFIVDAAVGGTPRQGPREVQPQRSEWSHDGKRIFVSGIRKPDAEYLNNDSEIYEILLTADRARNALTDRKGPDTNPTLSRTAVDRLHRCGRQELHQHLASLYLMDSSAAASGCSRRSAEFADDVRGRRTTRGLLHVAKRIDRSVLRADERRVAALTDGVTCSPACRSRPTSAAASAHRPRAGYVATFSVKGTRRSRRRR